MEKIIFTILFLFFSTISFADLMVLDSNSYQVVGKYSVQQFEKLIQGADNFEQIVTAAKEERVYITLDKITQTSAETYEGNGEIKIISRDKKEIVSLILQQKITFSTNNSILTKARIQYRNISEIGFPIAVFILVIFLL